MYLHAFVNLIYVTIASHTYTMWSLWNFQIAMAQICSTQAKWGCFRVYKLWYCPYTMSHYQAWAILLASTKRGVAAVLLVNLASKIASMLSCEQNSCHSPFSSAGQSCSCGQVWCYAWAVPYIDPTSSPYRDYNIFKFYKLVTGYLYCIYWLGFS